jgi:hypothetical protein
VKQTRPIRLSSRWLGQWRYFSFALYTVLVMGLGFLFLRQAKNVVDVLLGLAQFGVYIYLYVIALRATNKLMQVSFDENYLYVQMKTQELLIPLENIKDVEIKSLGGTYEVSLFTPEQLGDKFYFKVSLLYPLNKNSKEDLIDRFWAAIEKAKRRKQDFQRNALMS